MLPSSDVLPPAFFPVGLNLVGRRCVVVGDDREAAEKAAALASAGAEVVRVLNATELRDEDLAAAFFVIATPQDAALGARLRTLADAHRFLLCCIDQPAYGFVAMQAIVASGPARIAISTGGVAPRVGKLLKQGLERALGPRFARFLECHRALRRRVRSAGANADERRHAMIALADGFALEVRVRYPAWFEDAEHRLGPTVTNATGEE
ncbi:MAG: NAD(P)-dependent oxidoreductase [Candidatus Baltobacteraceae bacterium]